MSDFSVVVWGEDVVVTLVLAVAFWVAVRGGFFSKK
jgi:hypothetical protein